MMDACHEMKEWMDVDSEGSYDSLGMHRMDLDWIVMLMLASIEVCWL